MKKTYLTLVLLLIISISITKAQCPKKAVNCAYGCGMHIDNNYDGYCDYSILSNDVVNKIKRNNDSIEKELNKTENKIADIVKIIEKVNNQIDIKPIEKSEIVTEVSKNDGMPVESDSLNSESDASISDNNESINEFIPPVANTPQPVFRYRLLFISALTFGLYLMTF